MTSWKTLLVWSLLAAIPCAGGCDQKSNPTKPKHEEKHAEIGPHKGAIAEWDESDETHAEFTVDHKSKTATVYILDHEIKKAKPIAAKEITVTLKDPHVTFKLLASPEKGDPAGTSSRFIGADPALETEKDFEGTISAKVGDKEYKGDFKETDEGEHPHKH
jgi:hypothetical protein